ncbi:hypothetical protein OPT61_g4906 [Boeremia exigua]|uniref:Uncharacterized protein n=1 Tax=Boeremia exigua TaxID=749465 RepID=A0ACC2ICG5_9PLEO|nr:hypothetical protein OPT61_g4906 [Boeremia exigua]
MIRWTKAIGGVILLWNTSNIIAGFLICRPLSKNWNFAMPGVCGSQPAFYFAMGIINLLTDSAIIVLPMPYLYKLQLATGKKVLTMALLGIGIGTWAVTIYRQIVLPSLNFMDMPYSGTLTTILSGMEPAIAIVLACIPLMKPLFRRFSSSAASSQSVYDTGELSGGYTKPTGSRREHSGVTDVLFEDDDDNDEDDNDSQIQLQPVDVPKAGISIVSHDTEGTTMPHLNGTITVKKSWAVHSE